MKSQNDNATSDKTKTFILIIRIKINIFQIRLHSVLIQLNIMHIYDLCVLVISVPYDVICLVTLECYQTTHYCVFSQ